MTETSAPATELFSGYRTRGMTDDVTECERCGKVDLRGTVIVEVLDPDGNVIEVAHWGTTCAAKYGKVKVSVVKAAVRAAEVAAREAEREARRAAEDARTERYWAAFGPWLNERYALGVAPGATQLVDGQTTALRLARKAEGAASRTQFGAMCEFEAETGKGWNQW